MKQLDTFQKYLVEEFYDDYREGLLAAVPIRRVAFIQADGCDSSRDGGGWLPTNRVASRHRTDAHRYPGRRASGACANGTAKPPVGGGRRSRCAGERNYIPQRERRVMGHPAQPAAEGVYPAILVCHENRGRRPIFKMWRVVLPRPVMWRWPSTCSPARVAQPRVICHEVPGLLTQCGPEPHAGRFLCRFRLSANT